MTISLLSHTEPYYVVVIPEEIAITETGASAEIGAKKLLNMEEGDALEVRIGGLDDSGNAILTRSGAEDTLAVAVTDEENVALANQALAARFQTNNLTPVEGGTVLFGAPQGTKKAGVYTGIITFMIAYKEAKG